MKFRYYLRGIGIGIVFTAIIVLVVYSNNIPQRMTDEDVIRRAKQLGMVEADDPISKLIDKDDSKVSDGDSTDTKVDNSSTEAVTSETSSSDSSATEEQTTEVTTDKHTEQTTEKSIDNNTEQTTEKNTEQAADNNDSENNNRKTSGKNKETIEITIDRGSSSFPVCQKLEELGMIDDAAKFDDYLIENGYADRISVGKHKLTKGMDYHEIAELISDPLE